MSTVHIRWPLPPAFEPVREIAAGVNSVVCEAVQRSTGRAVAVKVLTASIADDASRRRFERECMSMAAVAAHPNIVTILDAGIHEERPWIAMELCRRGSLASAGALDVVTVLDVLVAVADAMDAAHRLGILHCDLKPANLLITDYGAFVVGDFGIARPSSTEATVTGGGYSLDHAAPEVLDGGPATTATDVYCLGATVWTLLSGRSPFRDAAGLPASMVIRRILDLPLPAPPPHTPDALTALLLDMTRKAPGERVSSMAEVARRAREIHDRPPVHPAPSAVAPRTSGAHPRPVVPRPRPADRDAPDQTVIRKRRPESAIEIRDLPIADNSPGVGLRSAPWPIRILLALTVAIMVVLLGVGTAAAFGVLGGTPTDSRGTTAPAPIPTPTPTPTSPPSAPPPSAPPIEDLGLDVPPADLACDGRFIVIVGSAVTPGWYGENVSALLAAAPGAAYVLTADSCRSFQERTLTGDLIYAVFLGPFDTLEEACDARAGTASGLVRQLGNAPATEFPTC